MTYTRAAMVDFFCKAGGATRGYQLAGFRVIGVDIAPQRNYCGDEFIQGDAIELIPELMARPDVVAAHASPPCMRYSKQTAMHGPVVVEKHPDLVAATRDALAATGKPWVIENVEGAPLIDPIVLCGSMFGSRRLRRHRLFESNLPMIAPGPCRHEIQHDVVSVAGHCGGASARDGAARFGGKALWQEIMGIDWMSTREMAQAIPPFYARWIGGALRMHLELAGKVAS